MTWPGVWRRDAKGVEVLLGDGEELVVEGSRVTGTITSTTSTSTGNVPVSVTRWSKWRKRDGDFMIRPRHPITKIALVTSVLRRTRKHRMGRPWNIPSYDEPHSVTVGASVEGLAHVFESSGEVEFETVWDRLCDSSLQRRTVDELSFIFTDLTSGVTTYPACRFLTVVGPRENGRVDLDFNRANESSVRLTDFATLPTTLRQETTYQCGWKPAKRCPLSRIRSSELTLRCRERASI